LQAHGDAASVLVIELLITGLWFHVPTLLDLIQGCCT
jgi:hypothetical protein